MLLSRAYPAARAIEAKVFWFFFSKKNRFLTILGSPSETPRDGIGIGKVE